ncbi:hypothetical protein [Natrarchaeobaculum aegyptiacum]|uniref:hypothetical protein n=1 Tax=Natrarchaeobaculum aegyptiacum TaxID=745377 RepID=UPI0012603474|nr:hypothetical protein [Natrarchaeobaculum aegyptiacum]
MNHDEINTIIGISTLLVMIIFVGIPTAAEYYPNLFPTFLAWIPFSLLRSISIPVVSISIGFIIGWYLRGINDRDYSNGPETSEDSSNSINEIEGCVEKDGIIWKGLAQIHNRRVGNVDFPFEPRCPKCRKEMNMESYKINSMSARRDPFGRSSTQTRRLWECPDEDCGHSTSRTTDQQKEARKLFKGEVEKLVESKGEEHSLENIIERIDGEISPRSIWEEYAEVVDSSHVSTNCFP